VLSNVGVFYLKDDIILFCIMWYNPFCLYFFIMSLFSYLSALWTLSIWLLPPSQFCQRYVTNRSVYLQEMTSQILLRKKTCGVNRRKNSLRRKHLCSYPRGTQCTMLSIISNNYSGSEQTNEGL